MSLRNDTMKFSVLGIRSDIRIELQAPEVQFIRVRNSIPLKWVKILVSVKLVPLPEGYSTLVNVYVDLLVFTHIAFLHRPEVVDIGVNTI